MNSPQVILVNEYDQEIGQMEKMEAHEKGLLHRAFSVFIFNSEGEMLLQKRALHKYHSPGLWTNSCCSHPYPNENVYDAANRRLNEEMGMSTDLNFAFSFQYKAEFDNGLIEHEYDHVFIGRTDQAPKLNPEEVAEFKYISIDELIQDIEINPDDYTPWFKICLNEVLNKTRSVAV